MVPLTNSLYVPGKLCDVDHVIVDVGTGYYVRKVRLAYLPLHHGLRMSNSDAKASHKALHRQGWIHTNEPRDVGRDNTEEEREFELSHIRDAVENSGPSWNKTIGL